MKGKDFFIRLIYAFVGDIILALGAALLIYATLGVDAFTVANLGISSKLGLSLGVYQMIFGIVVGIIIFFTKRHHLGVASIINILFTGYFIDFFMSILDSSPLHALWTKVLVMILALVVYSIGISMYSTSGLGAGPYDALAPLLSELSGWKFEKCRILVDSTFFIIGFIFHGPIGIASVLTAFCLGPMIGFWNKTIVQPSLKKLSS